MKILESSQRTLTSSLGEEMRRFIVIAVIFTGCSERVINTPLGGSRPPSHQILIEQPPTRVVYVGAVTPAGQKLVQGCLADFKEIPYKNYKFNTVTVLNTDQEATKEERTHHTTEIKK